MKKPTVKVCHICGSDKTLKGVPLKGDYCSPLCRDKAYARPDSQGIGQQGTQGYLLNSDKDYFK